MSLSSSIFKCSNCSFRLEVSEAVGGTAFLRCPNCGRGRGQVPIVHLLNSLMREVVALTLANEARRTEDRKPTPLTFEAVKQELMNCLAREECNCDYDYS